MPEGKAHRLALQLVEQAARIMGAPRLIPISFAHIDACFYTGQSHVDFVKFLAGTRRNTFRARLDQQQRRQPR